MYISKLDHLVLTVKDIPAAIQFYTTVLGMQHIRIAENRDALLFGSQKINIHEHNKEIAPHASQPTPGSADLCFLTDLSLDKVIAHVQSCGVPIIEGPVKRAGATGEIISIYLRDPEGNLIEISNKNNE